MMTIIIFFALALTAWILPVVLKIKRRVNFITKSSGSGEENSLRSFSPWESLYIFPILSVFFTSDPVVLLGAAAAAFLLVFAFLFTERRGDFEKLVYTPEVQRLLGITYALYWLIAALGIYIGGTYSVAAAVIWLTAAAFLPPAVVQAASWINKPIENRVRRRAVEDARRLLKTMPKLSVIGVLESAEKAGAGRAAVSLLAGRFHTLEAMEESAAKIRTAQVINRQLQSDHDVLLTAIKAGEEEGLQEIFRYAGKQCIISTGAKEEAEQLCRRLDRNAVIITIQETQEGSASETAGEARIITCTGRTEAVIYVSRTAELSREKSFSFKKAEEDEETFYVFLPEKEPAAPILAAATTALALGMTPDQIEEAGQKQMIPG